MTTCARRFGSTSSILPPVDVYKRQTEKQTLMESLAARYDMTFLGLHTFDRWDQSCTPGIFEKDGRKFVFVPGDTVTLGWERSVSYTHLAPASES